MVRGMYSAASALVAASEQQDVTAHNLAHASSPGYRQRGVAFETFDRVLGRATSPTGDIVGTAAAGAFHDFRPGPVTQTSQPYDLALSDPDRFFVLGGPNGPVYTRNGGFHLSADRQLVSQGGYPVQGEDGPITVPANAVHVRIATDGSITADRQPLGNLRIVRFNDPQQLTAVGPTLYSAPVTTPPVTAPGQVLQGYREGSNVEPAEAMVRMILGTRYYDAAQRSLRTIAESLQLVTRPTT